MSFVLAVDLGGTSLRAGLLDPTGALLALRALPHRTAEEADADAWWRDLQALLADLPKQDVAGVALGGFTRSQVLLDAAGHPVRPAQCFPDGRATAEAEELSGLANPGWTAITPYHPLARLLWVRRHDPAAFARARHLLQPKDYLAFCLTGRIATDTVANAWARDRAGHPAPRLLAAAGFDPALLPEMLPPEAPLGRCTLPGLEGVPVFCGSMDSWMASLGAGAGRPGEAYLISGTTDVAGVLAAAPETRPGRVTLPWGAGPGGAELFHTGGPSSAGAACADWAAETLGLPDAAAVVALAETARPDPAAPFFLPALMGERAPHWRPEARGAFLGLDRAHGAADLARAVLEGVAMADRALLEGLEIARLVLTGGGARSDFWCRLRAEVLGCPLHRAATPEPGLLGAAVLAFAALGQFPSRAAAQAALCRTDASFPGSPGGADARYALFKRAQTACMGLMS